MGPGMGFVGGVDVGVDVSDESESESESESCLGVGGSAFQVISTLSEGKK